MRVIPLTLKQANELVKTMHRHHKPTQGHRFSLGALKENKLVGAVIVGRPVSRGCDQYLTAEATRLVTDGTKNACSFLYSAAARVAKEMGFKKIQTYILNDEPGTSLIAAGWQYEGDTRGGDWASSKTYKAQGRRQDQPQSPKKRYSKLF